jgi:hypothetical protein
LEKFEIEFETYTEEYSANSFYEHYKDNLPHMVMVTQGYLGEVGFERFDRGQVIKAFRIVYILTVYLLIMFI